MRRLVPLALLGLLLPTACRTNPPSPAPRPTSTCAPTPPVDCDLRPQFAAFGLPPRGQGARPTCSIFTTVAAFEFALATLRGRGQRLSVEYANWAANAATGRADDGDFFQCALTGYETFGLCRDELWPYAATFPVGTTPPPAALVDGGRLLGEAGTQLGMQWLKPPDGKQGLDDAQFRAVQQTLADGWPVAAGSGHSRLLVGYRSEPSAPGGGVFLTLDSALAAFAEVSAAYVKNELFDVFAIRALREAPKQRSDEPAAVTAAGSRAPG
ncbi:MAG: hypothetical protein U1F60_13060 [Planctomycetota bacterium]